MFNFSQDETMAPVKTKQKTTCTSKEPGTLHFQKANSMADFISDNKFKHQHARS